MARKIYRVSVTFPDLSSAHAEQQQQVEGGNIRVAVNRALADILKRSYVVGRRIRSAIIRVNLIRQAGRE